MFCLRFFIKITSNSYYSSVLLKKMYKPIPEIRVSSTADNTSENELLSDFHSDIVTDSEILESQSTPLMQTVKYEEEALTDVEGSNDEDSNETVSPNYSLESLNRVFDIGMNCEEITNFKEPSKLQKTITFDKLKLNKSDQDNYRTDIENFDDSDSDINEIEYECDISNDYLQTSNFTTIIDNVTIEKITPSQTPEPGSENKTLTVQSKVKDCFTDTEILLSDNENKTNIKKMCATNKSSRYLSDSFTSDSDEDGQIKEKIKNIPKKLSNICTKEMKSSTMRKAALLVSKPQEINATDTEVIEVDNIRTKGSKKYQGKRQNFIQKSQTHCDRFNNCQLMKSWKHSPEKKWQKIQIPSGHECNRHNLKPALTETGHLTDVEAFAEESDEDIVFEDVKPVCYIPESKSDLVLSSQNDKGDVSLIMPLRNTSSIKNLKISSNIDADDHTDTEDLPGFEETNQQIFPTPVLYLDNTIVTNVESVIDKSKLKIKLDIQEPLTDTEELDLQKHKESFRKVNINYSKSPQLVIKECLTDVEDLSDTETPHLQAESAEAIERTGTDIDILSDLDGDDEYSGYCAAETPEIKAMNSFTTAKEGIGPFPTETKQQLNETIPKIRTLSPIPVPNDTDSEDLLGSMDEEQLSNDVYSTDEENLETHMSVVHIKHSRKFPLEGVESLHIKNFDNQPDPTTDVEEIAAPLDDHAIKNRNAPEDSSVSFNKSTEGISCKWHSKRRSICNLRGNFSYFCSRTVIRSMVLIKLFD